MTENVAKINHLESVSVTYTRVLATFCIVACHWFDQWAKIPALGQLFNVGVPIFLIISGFLYGRKQIGNVGKWYAKQFWKIVIPVYVYYAFSTVILLVMGQLGELKWRRVLLQLLNLQGFITSGIGNVQVAHLWFISYILLCYLITPFLQWLRDSLQEKAWWLIVAVIVVTQMTVVFLKKGVQANQWWWILAYVSGYFFSANHQLNIKRKKYILLSVITAVALIIRLVLGKISSGEVWLALLYERVVVFLTHIVLAWWILLTVTLLTMHYPQLVQKSLPTMSFFDRISFEIYIVHQALMLGTCDLLGITSGVALATLLLIVGTALGTAAIHCATLAINRLTGLCGRGIK